MAHEAIASAVITEAEMNSSEGCRVEFPFGTFSVLGSRRSSGTYLYAYKRAKGHLHKVYVGKAGQVTKDMLHKATLRLRAKVEEASE